MYNVDREEIYTMKATIESAFGAAARHAESLSRRGFQAQVSRMAGVDSSNLNMIIRKDKGASEGVRRKIFDAICSIVPELSILDYEGFMRLGADIVEGRQDVKTVSAANYAGQMINANECRKVAIENSRHVEGMETICLHPMEAQVVRMMREKFTPRDWADLMDNLESR